jgi:hypothetical protein
MVSFFIQKNCKKYRTGIHIHFLVSHGRFVGLLMLSSALCFNSRTDLFYFSKYFRYFGSFQKVFAQALANPAFFRSSKVT